MKTAATCWATLHCIELMVLAHIRDSNMNECVLRKTGKIHRFVFQKCYKDLEGVVSIYPKAELFDPLGYMGPKIIKKCWTSFNLYGRSL